MIALSADREEAIRREAERAYPNECCGILLGHMQQSSPRSIADTDGTAILRGELCCMWPSNMQQSSPRSIADTDGTADILSVADCRVLVDSIPIENAREVGEQYHRFRIEPEDLMKAELAARKRTLDVLGFYHSHPDHPAKPSDYDKEHALPYYSYIITAVDKGRAGDFTSWELKTDRSEFLQEQIKRL